MRGPLLYLLSYFSGSAEMIDVIFSAFSVLVVLFMVFPFRNFARCWVAKQLGDDTAEREGMLTINPLAHIDPMGALCMCICCIGWTKPAPVNFARCRKVSQSTAVVLVSMTGPLSLFLLGYILMIIAKVILLFFGGTEIIAEVNFAIQEASLISVYLAVLNLLPVPPFDGYYIIAGILPRNAAIWMERNAQIINIVVMVLLISGVLSKPLSILSSLILMFMDMSTMWINMLG